MTARPPHGRMLLVAAGIYASLAMLCTLIPLFDHPGFEFAFVFAVVGPLVAGRITIGLASGRYHQAGQERPFSVVRQYFSALGINAALLLIPLAVILLNGLRVPLCDVEEGIAFFLLLPVTGVVFSVALALFCTVHYSWPKSMFAAFFLLSLAYAVYLGYTTPAIFSFNFFYGYFPGLTYDELLPLELPLVLFRLFTFAAAAFLVWLTALIAGHSQPDDGVVRKGFTLARTLWRQYLRVSLGIATFIFLIAVFRCELRWESTAGSIRQRLGGVRETAHFAIFYDSATVRPAAVDRLAAEHEFQLARIQEQFALPHVERITSCVYPSAEAKRMAIGAGQTELAKPWLREVHITAQNVETTLKHELVHVVAAPFGLPVIHASTSPGLTEGLAIAVEGTWGGRTLAEQAALLRRAGLMPPMERMLGATGFVAQSSSVSYVLAGAFAQHLIGRYGMRRFLLVYGWPSYEEVYGHPLPDLIDGWHRSLDSLAQDPADSLTADVLFRRPPLIGKVCVRLHARRLKEARRFVADHNYDDALLLYRDLAAVGGYDAMAGLMNLHARRQEYSAVIDLYDSLLTYDRRPSRYLPLAIVAGDAAWALDNPVRARALFETVRSAHITPSLTEAAAIRLLAIGDSAVGPGLRTFFLSNASDTVRVQMLITLTNTPGDSLRWYLRGRLHSRMQRYDEARHLFERAGFRGADPVLEWARCVALGDAALGSGQLQYARAAYWSALNYDGRAAAALEIDERIARCDFLEHYK
jgi:tetratricopeptide (TPR) repeat protein